MPDVSYRFTAIGHDSVVAAFKSIEKAAASSSANVSRVVARQTRAQVTGAQTSQAAVKRSEERKWKEVQAFGRKLERELAREAQMEARAEQRKTTTRQRMQEKALRDFQRNDQRNLERIHKQQIRSAERAEREVSKVRRNELMRRARAEEGEIAARAQLRSAVRGQAWSGIRAGVGMFARGAAMATTAAVGAGTVPLHQGLRIDEMAARIAVQARGKGEAADVTGTRRALENVAFANPGVSVEQVGAGVGAYIGKTGDAKAAFGIAGDLAKVSSATGTAMSDLAIVAADLQKKLDITTVEEMRDAWAILVSQGKEGTFELKDAAGQYASLLAAGQRFGIGKGTGALKTIGGLTQMVRDVTGSPEEARTGIEAMFRQLTAKTPELKRAGVDVFNKDGSARPIHDLLVDVVSKVGGGDIAKKKVGMQQIFGDEGMKAMSPLLTIFAEATQKGADGATALRAALEKSATSSGDWQDVMTDAATMQSTTSAKLDATWQRLVASVSAGALPALDSLATKLQTFADEGGFDSLGDFIGLVIDGFAWLAEAAMDVAEFFGLISKRDRTDPIKRQERAQRQIDALGLDEKMLTKFEDVTTAQDLMGSRFDLGKAFKAIGIEDTAKNRAKYQKFARLQEERDAAATAQSMTAAEGPQSREDFINRLGANKQAAFNLAREIVGNQAAVGMTSLEQADVVAKHLENTPGAYVDAAKSQDDATRKLVFGYGQAVAERTPQELEEIRGGKEFDQLSTAATAQQNAAEAQMRAGIALSNAAMNLAAGALAGGPSIAPGITP